MRYPLPLLRTKMTRSLRCRPRSGRLVFSVSGAALPRWPDATRGNNIPLLGTGCLQANHYEAFIDKLLAFLATLPLENVVPDLKLLLYDYTYSHVKFSGISLPTADLLLHSYA